MTPFEIAESNRLASKASIKLQNQIMKMVAQIHVFDSLTPEEKADLMLDLVCITNAYDKSGINA